MAKFKTSALFLFALALFIALAPLQPQWFFGVPFSFSRNDLWRIIHHGCAPSARFGLSFPCAAVVQTSGDEAGYAVLPVGSGHVLTIPTRRIVGVESPELLTSPQPNYWQAAWDARTRLDRDLGRPLDRSDVALALNSALGRSQDQFHIHTACVRAEVKAALARESPTLGAQWMRMGTILNARRYAIRWVSGTELGTLNILAMLPVEQRASPEQMARQLVLVIGGWDRNGAPGFFVLNDQVSAGDIGYAENLMDFGCKR